MASISDADQLLLQDNPNLSSADIKTYRFKKGQLYKLTIAICVIYGIVAFSVLIITLFTNKGNQIFTEEIRPFTLTFVGGMIFVITILIIQIYNFKPKAYTVSTYDRDICPDFWKIVPTPSSDPDYSRASPSDKGLLKYKCVPDNSILNTTRVATAATSMNPYNQKINENNTVSNTITNFSPSAPLDLATTKLIGNAGNNGYVTNINGLSNYTLQCDKLFPNYLSNKNNTDTDLQQTPNALSCAYAKACGIPWSGQCGQ